ncbi:nitroimidazol reductase NimA-like FMN-containing flavoprotein (pyridoxamine 5'-phosphate oxidase superfamily) [Streptomyces olivoverticillatus]|uniref:Nitroimidazol reductase NimA-like FMN-containing flavoprotein (Pyridoxamine 5'-phosphate oxidase superfamily) n=1 Tax=Streptomyces olivoverticillatus TaxID=66427 RepID=A0A7W7PLV2_9ACTN|nr:pyridoxamine 5'-phosphate oxidase family protein [Streptomyces olivoverticillatus]MBB4893808.1 nitroimidazol reductase NimA-like FMN-containing flavoprotein (pyridoxamine 5'-phosphate oxidase superfamily) [Streptomyces olivoverticillatus]
MSSATSSSTSPSPAHEQTDAYEQTERTTPTRNRDRASYDREVVHSILDAGCVCHLGFIRDGAPVVLPTLYGRIGDRLYVHGSTGSRPLRTAARTEDPGMPVCLTVTHLDGLVLARSAFHHSLNYRSVVVHGTARQVTDEAELRAALDALVNQAVPGRAADSRPANAKELAATAVLRVDLREVSAKIRNAGPGDEPEDLALPHWSGVVPVATAYGTPVPADDLAPGIPVPAYLTAR